MLITISYHGPYQIHRHPDSQGNYNLDAIKLDLVSKVSSSVAHSSGVYIYLQRTAKGKWLARYVGINTNNHILNEALLKTNILNKEVLDAHGSRWLLILACQRPSQMRVSTFDRLVRKLEKTLVLDLAIKGHPLENINLQPKKPHIDFAINDKSKAAVTFKKLIKRKFPHI